MNKGRTTNLEKLVGDARKRADAIRRDGDISEEARARRLAELVGEVKPEVEAELHAIDSGYESDLEALREKARKPARERDQRDELLYEMKRARIERSMVARWTLLGEPSPEEYAEILVSGDDVAADVFEDLAPAYAGDEHRYGLRAALEDGKEQRRSPEQRRADDEARSLELERESAIVMGEFTDPKDPAAREKFATNLLERGLRSVHREGPGWVGTDEAERLDTEEVA